MNADLLRTYWDTIRAHLIPGAVEHDPSFKKELLRTTRTALFVIGGVQIGVSLFLVLARLILPGPPGATGYRLAQAAAVIALGLATIGCARTRRLEPWWRTIAIASGMATAAVLVFSSLGTPFDHAENFIPGQITLIMLVAVTVVPIRPLQAMGMGLGMGAIYLAAVYAVQLRLPYATGPDPDYLLFIVMLSLLSTGITAVVYQQRRSNFELRQEQVRSLLAENAASQARLAAALSHELNNPMGALLSGVDTMLLLAARQATSSPEQQARLVVLQSDVRKSIQESMQRLRTLVARMQRFTNLDKAEVQSVNLNDLLTDVAALVQSQVPRGATVRLDLKPLKPLVCRPQQLSAVFNSLVTNAIHSLDSPSGEITIASQQRNGNVVVEIQDTGRGLETVQLKDIFDPAFRSSGTRVRAANWSMFSARQIIREHGGEIFISSKRGDGTLVRVTLPVSKTPLT
jgi:signal transduction histidine kinase